MNPLLPLIGIGAVAALLLGGNKKAGAASSGPVGSADPLLFTTILALLNQDTQEVGKSVNAFRGRGDLQTAGALEAEQGRMQAAMVGQNVPPVFTLQLDGSKGPALDEWAGVLASVEGRPTILREWSKAFAQANMIRTAQMLAGKAADLTASASPSFPSSPSQSGGASGGFVQPGPPFAPAPSSPGFPSIPGLPAIPPSIPGLPSLPPSIPAGPAQPNADLQSRIAIALASGSSRDIRALASALRSAGFIQIADQLDARALEIETAASVPQPSLPFPLPAPVPAPRPAVPVQTVPPIVIPGTAVSPPIVIPVPPAPVDPQVALALEAKADLIAKPKTGVLGSPNSMLQLFQKEEGLVADGLYGPKSGIAMAEHGVIPPIPRQYHTKTKTADKAKYREQILEFAARDPARRSEWLLAAQV